ncbi:MAG: hypothetical protein WCK06_03600 [Actinomycetota bacterium]
MSERANAIFPFAIAVVLPPAGILLGLLALTQEDRGVAIRLIVVSLLAAVVWLALLV